MEENKTIEHSRLIIRYGEGEPQPGDLLPNELGYSTDKQALYIGTTTGIINLTTITAQFTINPIEGDYVELQLISAPIINN